MTRTKFRPKSLLASALVAATALGTIPGTARAANGDITKGLVMGVVGGLAVNQLLNSQNGQARAVTRSTPVYTQPQPVYTQPRPVYRERRYEHRHHRAYRAPFTTASAHVAFNSQGYHTRRAIQYRLAQQGYYNGGIDGLWGPGTASAVYTYARTHGRLDMLGSVRASERLYHGILR